ncbi:hypothetical protein [Rhodococcus yananensis]|uniref:hypothetical protein n=1 Tax=Rhodococcus yananensis TaxID=2879464 RepID=UPI001CF84625|nr:hypothetical protein [Rhodococcus yananensis]
MAENNPFGFDPDDLDRVVREAGEELRDLRDRFLAFLDAPATRAQPEPRPATAGESGDGAWVVYTTDSAGVARVDQVYATELDALRALKGNTDPRRSVRFLPYGMSVSVLDRPGAHDDGQSDDGQSDDGQSDVTGPRPTD